MNFKLFSLLTVSLAGSVLLASADKAFGQTGHQLNDVEEVQHLVCIKEAQHLQCTVERSKEPIQNQSTVQKAMTESSHSSLVTVAPPAQNPTQETSVAQINQSWTTNTVTGLIFLIFVCSSGLGLFLYRKYRTNRVTVLRRNIEALERLWKISNIQ